MRPDWQAEGLLRGTRGRAREARIRLLDELAADGVPLEELRRAVAEDRLVLLPVERVLEGKGPRYTAAEVAARSGVDLEFLLRQRQALGLPRPGEDDAVFTDDDVEALRRLKTLLEAGLPADGLLESARVLGHAMAQVAAANRALVGEALLEPGLDEWELAHRYAAAAERFVPMLTAALGQVLNLHLREQIRTDVMDRAALAEGRFQAAQEQSVCFADLVGFTRLGEELAPEQIGAVGGRLAELAAGVAQPPVRVVKMIGDAAMLVSPDNDALLDAVLALVEAAEAEPADFPALRAGVARGPALARAGDYYGRPVNLASRVTAVAYPGSVLCTAEARDASAEERFRWSFAGARRLKGISGPVKLFRCRRASD